MSENERAIISEPLPVGVVVNDEQLRVKVGPTVQQALHDWTTDHRDDLIEKLRPYNMHPDEIFMPEWERIVRPSEVRGQ